MKQPQLQQQRSLDKRGKKLQKTNIETHSESHVYQYDRAEEVAIEQFGIFWSAEELGVHNDEPDLRSNLTAAEVQAITYLQSILNVYEDHLGDDIWGDLIPKRFPRREIVRACRVISMVETHSHAPFYKIMNEVLHKATDEFYSQWRYDGHLYKHIKFVEQCTQDEDSAIVTAALCGLEGINLFSAFGFFKQFNTRGWNYISHFVAGIDGSAKDENFHSMFSAWLFRQLRYEREQASLINFDYTFKLECQVYHIMESLYEHELAIIDKLWEFEEATGTTIRVVKKDELIEFVQDRVNVVLGYLGYEPMFSKEKGTISEQFYLNVSSFKSSDFFANTQLQYKRNWSRYKLKFNTSEV